MTAIPSPAAPQGTPAERAAGRDTFAFAVRHINASARVPVREDDLLRALLSGLVPPGLDHHVRAFYDETDVETLSDLARSGLITYARLAEGARLCLEPDHDTRRWLDERA